MCHQQDDYMREIERIAAAAELGPVIHDNPLLDPSRFTFSVPPGADVIGDPSPTANAQP